MEFCDFSSHECYPDRTFVLFGTRGPSKQEFYAACYFHYINRCLPIIANPITFPLVYLYDAVYPE